MSLPSRKFDIGVLGASSYTGKLILEELAHSSPPTASLAAAARNTSSLTETLKLLGLTDHFVVHQVDNFKQKQLDDFVGNCHVVIACAGPFAEIGISVVDACCRLGTHYIDITGEIDYMRRVIDNYDHDARAKGIMVVPSCGVDCVPSDLGAFFMNEYAASRLGSKMKKITGLLLIKGSASGGTMRSVVSMASRRELKWRDAYYLNPIDDEKSPGAIASSEQETDRMWPSKLSEFGDAWSIPSLFCMTNSRLTRRSSALARAWKGAGDTQSSFAYLERFYAPSMLSAFSSTLMGNIFAPAALWIIGSFPSVARFIEGFLPRPGQGLSAEKRSGNRLELRLIGTTMDGQSVHAHVRGPDSYELTAKTAAAAALCCLDIVQSSSSSHPHYSGVLTPAFAFGSSLVDRLNDRGVTFAVSNPSQ